ncbi:MAG: DUF2157 domain-containing protein, partial [Desulfuromonadales bacterium]|nr:DUF2157 domain-containing protein [Desulfuromonadales bacterium]
MNIRQKEAAQRRADRIQAFNEELAELRAEEVITLSEEDRSRVEAHHSELLADYAEQFDIDVSGTGKQLSWGM